jgi:hypothetical protein
MKYNLLLSIALVGIIFCVNYFILYKERTIANGHKYNLTRDGFCLYKNVLDNGEISILKQLCIDKNYKTTKEFVLNNSKLIDLKTRVCGNGYVFQDYIWIIQKSTVHTCHRDNNGDFFNASQKHPSYTVLVYLEDMDKCLGVMPGSHKDLYTNAVNVTNTVQNVLCSKGDLILFNANLVHVGTINARDDNLRIQLKLTHRDDISTLGYYQNFNKVLNQDNTLPLALKRAQKRFSCTFPFMSDLTQGENIRTARGSDNGVDIGLPQQAFSYLFYGNKDFYNLPNAF